MNVCQVGHTTHKTRVRKTYIGNMHIYDWEQYKDNAGSYCSGQDDISKTIAQTSRWEPELSELVENLLLVGCKKNAFVDIGCHIGWFSRIATLQGYQVIAYDGDEENLRLFKLNNPTAKYTLKWFDENTEDTESRRLIEVLKIDIEGNEQYAIEFVKPQLEARTINNIIMEVSPVFNDSYPVLVKKIVDYGYKAFEINGAPFNFQYDFEQKDLHFIKQ